MRGQRIKIALQLAESCQLRADTRADHKRFDVLISDDDSAIEIVRQYLSSTHSVKWLLVVDNADEHTIMGSVGKQSDISTSLAECRRKNVIYDTVPKTGRISYRAR